MNKESYLERAARLEFELRETGICTKGCCSEETLEAERIMQEAIKKPIDGKNSKPLPRKRNKDMKTMNSGEICVTGNQTGPITFRNSKSSSQS